MIKKLTIATRALTYSAITVGALFLYSSENGYSNKKEPIKTENTNDYTNLLTAAFGTLGILCGLGAVCTNKILKDKKHLESEAAKYNISVNMYRSMTEPEYGKGNDICRMPLSYKLSKYDNEKVLSILSKVEKRIDDYKNEYPQLKVLDKNEEKMLRQCIAKLREKASENKEITYIDEYVLRNITTSNKEFPCAFYEGLDEYFES